MKQAAVAFAVGFIFAIGLGISGMTQPHIVIGFLDPTEWNPTLLFVMLGAVLVHGIAYPFIRKRSSPLLDSNWYVPTTKEITIRLVAGAALFGIGWGMSGYCPGPALTAVVSGDLRVYIFLGAMLTGMILFMQLDQFLTSKKR